MQPHASRHAALPLPWTRQYAFPGTGAPGDRPDPSTSGRPARRGHEARHTARRGIGGIEGQAPWSAPTHVDDAGYFTHSSVRARPPATFWRDSPPVGALTGGSFQASRTSLPREGPPVSGFGRLQVSRGGSMADAPTGVRTNSGSSYGENQSLSVWSSGVVMRELVQFGCGPAPLAAARFRRVRATSAWSGPRMSRLIFRARR